MNRDDVPTGAAVALATGELMVTARRTVAMLAPGTGPADAVAAVRAAVGQLWPKVSPEAARDVMTAAAELACECGVTELPADVADRYVGQLNGAEGMLDFTGEWLAAGKPEPEPGRFTPSVAFASSVAFDRDEDDETLTSVAALLALAHMALRDRAEDAELGAHQAHEPEPGDYDPGPEVDDEGGMSEYRYHEPEPWS
jgi:hypothetical protein